MNSNEQKSVRLIEVLRNVAGRFAAEKAVREAKATAIGRLGKNVVEAYASETLFSSLSAASFSVLIGGNVEKRLKVSSIFDRFDGSTYDGFKNRQAFCLAVVRQVKVICGLAVADLLETRRAEGIEVPEFNSADATDQKIAFHVLGEILGFGTSLQKVTTRKVPAGTLAAIESQRDRLAALLG